MQYAQILRVLRFHYITCMVHGIDCDKLLEIVNEEANKAAE